MNDRTTNGLPFVALTPHTIDRFKNDLPDEQRGRWQRVRDILYGIDEYNNGRMNAKHLTEVLDVAFGPDGD